MKKLISAYYFLLYCNNFLLYRVAARSVEKHLRNKTALKLELIRFV